MLNEQEQVQAQITLTSWFHDHRNMIIELISDQLRQTKTLNTMANSAAEALADELINLHQHSAQEAITPDATASLEALFREWTKTTLNPKTHQFERENHLPTLLNIQSAIHDAMATVQPPANAVVLLRQSEKRFHQVVRVFLAIETQSQYESTSRAIEQAQDKSLRVDRHKADFISVASHELKTPLTLVEGYANMLKSDFPADDYPRAASVLKGILNGTQRLREIIEDMIDVSVIEMSTLDLNFQPIWFNRLLNIVMTDMRKVADQRQITISLVEDGIPTHAIEGDPERIFQAFIKVIENAIKYTPDGGNIKITGRLVDEMVEFCIEDSGIGINQKELGVIFEKFFTLGQVGLHSSSKTKFKGGGPGLGLALARGIVEAHEGVIWAESEGHDEARYPGTRFFIQLPNRQPQGMDTTEQKQHPALLYPIDDLPDTANAHNDDQ